MSQSITQFFYYKLYKPYGYLCQFSGESTDKLLGDLYKFPKDVYSVGRLDKDSEGLLLLTNDNRFKTRILSPESKKWKTYWVQVEGQITQQAIHELEEGKIVKTTLQSIAKNMAYLLTILVIIIKRKLCLHL